jgi:AraC-like DNA-binding protein
MLEALLYADEFWAYIARSVDYRLIRMVELSPSLPLPEEMQAEVYALLEGVKKHEGVLFSDEAEASPRLNSEIEESVAGGLAYALLMLLISLVDRLKVDAPHPVTRKEVLTHDFFELLAKHYVTERQVTFYASKLCVTPKHLSTMVKQVTHAPIQEWINSVTLLHIKRRLLTGTETIQQISEDLNFQTPSTFVRYFRQHTGVTPSKYRNNQ